MSTRAPLSRAATLYACPDFVRVGAEREEAYQEENDADDPHADGCNLGPGLRRVWGEGWGRSGSRRELWHWCFFGPRCRFGVLRDRHRLGRKFAATALAKPGAIRVLPITFLALHFRGLRHR